MSAVVEESGFILIRSNRAKNVDRYWGREPCWWRLNSWELDSLLNLKGLTGLSVFFHKKDGYVCKYGIPDPVVIQNLHFHCVLWSGGLLCFDLVLRQTGISVKHSENFADISRSSRRLETRAPAVPATQQLLLRQNDCCIFDALRRFQLVFGPWILRKLSSENKNHLCSSCRAETAQFPHPSVPWKSLTIFCAVGSNRTSIYLPLTARVQTYAHTNSPTQNNQKLSFLQQQRSSDSRWPAICIATGAGASLLCVLTLSEQTYWPSGCIGSGARCSASTQNIVLMFPLWRQDSERAKN